MSIIKVLVAALLCAAWVCAQDADARERGFVSLGMDEARCSSGWASRITKPSSERQVSSEDKTWTYFPHSRDPQTLTIIKFRSGVVANVERKISR